MIGAELAWVIVGLVCLVAASAAAGFAIGLIRLAFMLHRQGGSEMIRFLERKDQ